MPDVVITEYTDPACPWAFSAEPFRRRLDWIYGDAIEWRPRMVGLSDSTDQGSFTPERLSGALEWISREHGMPIATRVRPRMAASVPACRAVVAARLHSPAHERPLLRRLRIRNFSAELLDDQATLDGAASDVGLDPADLRAWMDAEETAAALDEDMAAARNPSPAALAMDHKLAGWDGGRRYTCPSYEVARVSDGLTLTAPGFQPYGAYEVAVANLAPDAPRRSAPGGVEEVLEWAGEPLATKEVAVVCDLDTRAAREALARVATEIPLGADGQWHL